ncbi:Bardet-Biedl syndrome 1 protein homolog [Durusdinium trenchii]|uniref:Bardet-Biedl syndrome 1 protein homolog n=1 Tax=Durusdinium trenchii TaxID=1381693 RepID=A0ABP0SAJ6_9DINO
MEEGKAPQEMWLQAWEDPVAGLHAFSGGMCLAQDRLLVGDLSGSLKEFREGKVQKAIKLNAVPTAVCGFWEGAPGGVAVPLVAVACGPSVKIFKDLRPYFKFTGPASKLGSFEQDVWAKLRSGSLDVARACQVLREQANLSQRSMDVLALENDPDRLERYVQEELADDNYLKPVQACITCMGVLKVDVEGEVASPGVLVLGTEARKIHILEPGSREVAKTITLRSVPVHIAVTGTRAVEYRIVVACRDHRIYSIKNGNLVRSFIDMESPICGGIARCGKDIIFACMNQTVQSYTVKGRKNWTLHMPDRISNLSVFQCDRISMSGFFVALRNGEVRLYIDKTLMSTIDVGKGNVVTGLAFGQFNREPNTLMITFTSGALAVKILKRTAKLDPSVVPSPGPPSEQDIPLPVPKKTKLYVEQTQREREQAVEMHRTFQHSLCKLRFLTAKSYLRLFQSTGLANSQMQTGTTARGGRADADSMNMSVDVHGLGPRFRVVLEIENLGAMPLVGAAVSVFFDNVAYHVHRPFARLPALLPQVKTSVHLTVDALLPGTAPEPLHIAVSRGAYTLYSMVVEMPLLLLRAVRAWRVTRARALAVLSLVLATLPPSALTMSTELPSSVASTPTASALASPEAAAVFLLVRLSGSLVNAAPVLFRFLTTNAFCEPRVRDHIRCTAAAARQARAGAGKMAAEKKRDFMEWFDQLGYEDPDAPSRQGGKVEPWMADAEIRKMRRRRAQKGGRVTAKYLEIPQRYQPPVNAGTAADLPGKKKTSSKATSSCAKLPRVATLAPRSRSETRETANIPSDAEHHLLVDEEVRLRIPGIMFWQDVDVVRLCEKGQAGFIPTLVFDFQACVIHWVCFSEGHESFHTVKEMAGLYARVVQSLCFFNSSPLVSLRTAHSTGNGDLQVRQHFVLSKTDLIGEMERVCKLYSQISSGAPVSSSAPSVAVFQAVVPETFGTLRKSSRTSCKLIAKVERLAHLTDLHAHVVFEPKGDTQLLWIQEVTWFRNACADGSNTGNNNNNNNNNASEDERMGDGRPQRSSSFVERQVVPTRRPHQDNLQEAFRWCIGDHCKSASREALEQARDSGKKQVVYKLVLQHRYQAENASALSEMLPDNLRKRMFGTVKVCSICFDELTSIEKAKAAQEAARRVAVREQKALARIRKLGKKAAREASEMAKERRTKLRDEAAAAAKAARAAAVEAAKAAKAQAIVLLEQKSDETGDDGANRATDNQDYFVKRNNDESKQKPIEEEEDPKSSEVAEPPQVEVVDFPGVSCASFFGDDVAKLAICQGIMDTLRSGKAARVIAPVAENNDSAEECRLVLRSLYLEFRGMCVDQGYFPDVPVEEGIAVMTLDPLPRPSSSW